MPREIEQMRFNPPSVDILQSLRGLPMEKYAVGCGQAGFDRVADDGVANPMSGGS